MPHRTAAGFDRWMGRALRLVALVALVLVCVLLWRAVVIVGQLQRGINIAADRTQAMADHISEMSSDIQGLDERLESMEAQLGRAVQQHEIERAVARVLARTAAPEENRDVQQSAIDALLKRIRNPDLHYETEDDEDTAAKFYAKALTKYQYYGGSSLTPEQFISHVSSTTFEDDPYYVVFPDGQRKPVKAWLQSILEELRRGDTDAAAR